VTEPLLKDRAPFCAAGPFTVHVLITSVNTAVHWGQHTLLPLGLPTLFGLGSSKLCAAPLGLSGVSCSALVWFS
jgi:hypothetical protein